MYLMVKEKEMTGLHKVRSKRPLLSVPHVQPLLTMRGMVVMFQGVSV